MMKQSALFLLFVAAMLGCAACQEFPTGSKMFNEPESRDQLIPLARGNYWRYREVVSGNPGRPAGRFVIHDVEEVVDAHVRGYNYLTERFGDDVDCGDIAFTFYKTGTDGWGILFEGVMFGTITSDPGRRLGYVATAYAMIPKDPQLGKSYKELKCVGMETVVTPAGTFECYRFDRYDRSESYWWSRGTGLVQYQTNTWADSPTEHWVLESFKVQD